MSTELTNAVTANSAMAKRFIAFANQLETTITTNGDTDFEWLGGDGFFSAMGTFSSGTATLKFSTDGSNFATVGASTTLTASGGAAFSLPKCTIRITLSGAGTPSIALKIQKDEI